MIKGMDEGDDGDGLFGLGKSMRGVRMGAVGRGLLGLQYKGLKDLEFEGLECEERELERSCERLGKVVLVVLMR